MLGLSDTFWASLVGAIVGGVLAAIAAILGSLYAHRLSEKAAAEHEKHIQAEKRASVRAGIQSEIKQNREILGRIQSDVPLLFDLEYKDQVRQEKTARDFLKYPFFGFRKEMFHSQLSAIPSAISSEEVARVMTFYTDLDSIEFLRAQLISASHYDERHASREIITGKVTQFNTYEVKEKGPKVMLKINELVKSLVSRSDPIQ